MEGKHAHISPMASSPVLLVVSNASRCVDGPNLHGPVERDEVDGWICRVFELEHEVHPIGGDAYRDAASSQQPYDFDLFQQRNTQGPRQDHGDQQNGEIGYDSQRGVVYEQLCLVDALEIPYCRIPEGVDGDADQCLGDLGREVANEEEDQQSVQCPGDEQVDGEDSHDQEQDGHLGEEGRRGVKERADVEPLVKSALALFPLQVALPFAALEIWPR